MARKKTAEQPQGEQPEQQPEQTQQPEPEQSQGEQPEQQPEQTQQPEPEQSQSELPEQQLEQTQPDDQQPQQPVELKSFVMVQHMAGIDLDWPIGSEHTLPVDQADRLINAKIAKAKE